MKKLNSIFFLLFLLLITGSFAAIAKNSYGMDIIAWTTVGFAFFSLTGGISTLLNNRQPKLLAVEYFILSIIFAIVAMRAFLIYFPYVEILFSGASLGLIIIYIIHIVTAKKEINPGNKPLFITVNLFYASIALYAFAMLLNPMNRSISEIIGAAGFIIILLSFIYSRTIKSITIKGKEVNWSRFMTTRKNKSVLLSSLFILFTLYAITNTLKIIPEIQSSRLPKGYYELVKEAENGSDVAKNGKFRYQEFRQQMEKFAEDQGIKE